MATSKDDILKAIEEMSVMDLVDLISAIEEKFGVTAAAAVAAAPAAAADAGGEAAEEKDAFDVVLNAAGDQKVQVIKAVRAITGLGLKEAKDLVDGAQIDILATLPSRDEALGLIASVLQAPVSKFATLLNEVPSKLARVLSAVHDNKQASA